MVSEELLAPLWSLPGQLGHFFLPGGALDTERQGKNRINIF